MQSWHLIPIVILPVIIVLTVVMRKRLGQQAQAAYDAETGRLYQQWAAQRRPGETEPAFVIAMTRSMFKAEMFMVALTSHRLLLATMSGPLRSFEPGSYSFSLAPQRWVDSGNMTTTHSSGLEGRFQSGAENYTWRIYDQIEGYGQQAASVQALRGALRA